jgi:hypothetical protein
MLAEILKKLAEMFPQQDYQSRLEKYISNRYPTSAVDVEFLERQFYHDQHKGKFI